MVQTVQNDPEWSEQSRLVLMVQNGPNGSKWSIWSKIAQSVKMVLNYMTWSRTVHIFRWISNPEISERYFFLGHPVLVNLTVTVFVNSTIASTIIEMAVLSSDTLMHSLILQPLPLFLFTYV